MDPTFLPAWRLAEMIRGGAISCLELLDHYIARVERLDGRTNAVVARDFDRARDRARALDSQRKDGRATPLFGVPMTVKESFNLAGLPTTWGHEAQRNSVAHEDALAVQRLTAAGAVVLGKTNVPVDLADWQSFNPVYGATSNPWNLAHTPGGSSGGGAAAMAAGFAALELGSDIGGSIRVPAHYCGVFGHKPSWGLCSGRGQSLVPIAAMTDIAVIGPLARSATDLLLALDVIAGADPVQDVGTVMLPPPRAMRLSELRIAVWSSEPGQETDAETTMHIEALADFLEREGAQVSRIARPGFDVTEAFHIYVRLLTAALSGRASEELLAHMRAEKARRPADDMSAAAFFFRSVDMTHREWLHLNERRFQIRRSWGTFFRDWDVLLCPVITTAALPHMQQGETWERQVTVNGRTIPYNDMLFWPGITCAFHLPASTAPIGSTAAGLPIGVQIVGPFHGDRTTIHVAGLLERHWRSFVPPPGWE
ncbi:MAG TPA: amidase [Acetobacteraceae bacterium]|nr:amidase [Acetobacteraceae bacterium]